MAPKQKPGKSKQDYRTPVTFLDAVKRCLGIDAFDFDLCADDGNAVAPLYFTKEFSALDEPTWKMGDGWNWMNPEFSNIAPWVARAYREACDHGARTAVLIPASVGANWWRDYVDRRCEILLLNGRISFDGTAPYPKDCALLLYHPIAVSLPSYDVWTWRA